MAAGWPASKRQRAAHSRPSELKRVSDFTRRFDAASPASLIPPGDATRIAAQACVARRRTLARAPDLPANQRSAWRGAMAAAPGRLSHNALLAAVAGPLDMLARVGLSLEATSGTSCQTAGPVDRVAAPGPCDGRRLSANKCCAKATASNHRDTPGAKRIPPSRAGQSSPAR
jgi:hypothetical protein